MACYTIATLGVVTTVLMPTVGQTNTSRVVAKPGISQLPRGNSKGRQRAVSALVQAASLVEVNKFQEALPYAIEATQLNPSNGRRLGGSGDCISWSRKL